MSAESNIETSDLCPEPFYEATTARASYSSNPGFTRGATDAHRITSPDKSQLLQPLVAEALEAVYVLNLEEAPAKQLDPIDGQLAMSGLSWLRKNIDKHEAPQLRRSVIATKSTMDVMEWSERIRTEREQAHEQQSQKQQSERLAATEAEQIRQAKVSEEATLQANYYARLEDTVGRISENHPDLNSVGYLGLAKELKLVDNPQMPGSLGGKAKRQFRPTLECRIAAYLQDPHKVVNDLAVMRAVHEEAPDAATEPVVYAYNGVIFSIVTLALTDSHYSADKFSPKVIAKWLDVAEGDRPEARAHLSRVDEIEGSSQVTNEARHDVLVRTPATIYGGRIVENTLREVTRLHPERLIDTMYVVAQTGLDPENSTKYRIATHYLAQCLKGDPLATALLHMSTLSRNDHLKKKALDLQQTLNLLGVDDNLLGLVTREPSGSTKLSREDLKTLYRLFSKELESSAPDIRLHTQEMDDKRNGSIQEFTKWATTTLEGLSSTVYGRFLSLPKAQKALRTSGRVATIR